MQAKISAILADLAAHDWQPLIDSLVFRSQELQDKLVAEGKSKVHFSFHMTRNADGTPGSLAADITDARFPFEEPLAFKLMLFSSALAHGLTTGILFGISDDEEQRLRTMVAQKRFNGKPSVIGWDPWHVQPVGLTLAQAKKGKRPQW